MPGAWRSRISRGSSGGAMESVPSSCSSSNIVERQGNESRSGIESVRRLLVGLCILPNRTCRCRRAGCRFSDQALHYCLPSQHGTTRQCATMGKPKKLAARDRAESPGRLRRRWRKGAAWAVPAQAGHFVLAIRGMTAGCAVWAQSADPKQVEANFKTVVEGVKRPDLTIKTERDTISPSPVGQARAVVYSVFANGAQTGFVFTMLAAERSGGPFQASLQVAPSRLP